jgi:hypothetical protein
MLLTPACLRAREAVLCTPFPAEVAAWRPDAPNGARDDALAGCLLVEAVRLPLVAAPARVVAWRGCSDGQARSAGDLSSDPPSSTNQHRLLDELVEAPQHSPLNRAKRDGLVAESTSDFSNPLTGVMEPHLPATALCHYEAQARARRLGQLFREVPDEKVGVDLEESAHIAVAGVPSAAIRVGENDTGHRCGFRRPDRVAITQASQMRVPLQGRHRDLGRAPSEYVPEIGAEETAGWDVAATNARTQPTGSHRPSVLPVDHGYMDIHEDVRHVGRENPRIRGGWAERSRPPRDRGGGDRRREQHVPS